MFLVSNETMDWLARPRASARFTEPARRAKAAAPNPDRACECCDRRRGSTARVMPAGPSKGSLRDCHTHPFAGAGVFLNKGPHRLIRHKPAKACI